MQEFCRVGLLFFPTLPFPCYSERIDQIKVLFRSIECIVIAPFEICFFVILIQNDNTWLSLSIVLSLKPKQIITNSCKSDTFFESHLCLFLLQE